MQSGLQAGILPGGVDGVFKAVFSMQLGIPLTKMTTYTIDWIYFATFHQVCIVEILNESLKRTTHHRLSYFAAK